MVNDLFRLTPTYMILIGIMATIAPYLGNGPTWYIMDSLANSCRQHWWHNLLYVNNLVNYTNTAGEVRFLLFHLNMNESRAVLRS